MPIAVFDIDGTLTDTMDVDVQCYEAAVRSGLGLEIPEDWPDFDEVTDAAILATACERGGLEPPSADTQARIADAVGALLAVALRESPERFMPVAGARSVFAHLRASGWLVAMATGAWRPSALVKLDGAAIPHVDVPLATSSDHASRAAIIRHAVQRLGADDEEAVVYVGDGVWDGRAAGSLGYGFLGVSRGDGSELRRVGAGGVVRDFTDVPSLLAQLHRIASR
jgi:phosphoglycolate phosphatase-like HAD superfamily hydrolase